jgi:DNA-binding XRE family transcriptional regulator
MIKVRFGDRVGDLSRQVVVTALGAHPVGPDEDAELVVLTPADLDDLFEDAAATAAYHRTRDQESVPAELPSRLIAGDNPVKVWREYRKMTLRALAEAAGISPGYLSQIENGERRGTVTMLRRIAEPLGVELDDLT